MTQNYPIPFLMPTPSAASGTAEVHIVERILAKLQFSGRTEYLLQWRGYDAEYNSWEPAEYLDCPDLLAAFERRIAADASATSTAATVDQVQGTDENGVDNKDDDDATEEYEMVANGFESGRTPVRILAVTKDSGRLMFLMQWDRGIGMVRSSQARRKCAQVVIAFYESVFEWATEAETSTDAERTAEEYDQV